MKIEQIARVCHETNRAYCVVKALKVLLVMIVLCTVGCNNAQKAPVWGKGELSAEWQEMFGSDNNARLDFAQSQIINKHEVLLRGLDVKDANGVKSHQNGLVDLVVNLSNRVQALETTK